MTKSRSARWALVLAVLLTFAVVRTVNPTHGAVAGDVTSSGATVWSRADEEATMRVSVHECGSSSSGEDVRAEVAVDNTSDFTGQVNLDGLAPGTCYEASVRFDADPSGAEANASFKTAPEPTVMRPVRFAWSGDLAGQNVCRDADEGFPLFQALSTVEEGLDFFVHLGDAIYGDGLCHATGLGGNSQVPGNFVRSSDLENYRRHWKYNLEDAGYQEFRSKQAFFMTWDDHEVVNDFGPGFDTRSSPPYTAGEHLLPVGMEALLNYNPIRAGSEPAAGEAVLYRSVRWGLGLELFILDTRQYRSLPTAPDSPNAPKTMLGETQLEWLKKSLNDSQAMWKVVATSVPLSVPTGRSDSQRDGWANYEGDTGYEAELRDILRFMQEREMHDVVFITADVHFAQALRYQPFANDPDFDIYEMIVGPLNAGLLPKRELDMTFSPERLFFYGPDVNTGSGLLNYSQIRPYFNFGMAEVSANGNITFSVINVDNEVVYSLTLAPYQGQQPSRQISTTHLYTAGALVCAVALGRALLGHALNDRA